MDIVDMKTMVLTTKTNHNPLNLDDLGGGVLVLP